MGFFDDSEATDGSNAVDLLQRVDSAQLHDSIIAVVRRGWLLSFGGSRDGYSVAVSLFGDGKQMARKYITDLEALNAALESIQERANDPSPAGAPKPLKKGVRGRSAKTS